MISSRTRLGLAAVFLATALAGPVGAQDIPQSHLDAALVAVQSAGASRGFDRVLPALAEQVQNQLIRMRPDLHQQITQVVEAMALDLVPRRKDLDLAVARIWAKTFTEDELVTIAEFYKSTTGQKFAELGPQVINDSLLAVQAWSDRVREELLEKSREELKRQGQDF